MSNFYQPPKINLIYKDILGVIYSQSMERNVSLINKEPDVLGFLFLGDSAKVSRIPLSNVLVSGVNLPVSLLELVDFKVQLDRVQPKISYLISFSGT